MTYARWPKNKKDWPEVWAAVSERYPGVAKSFKGGKFWKKSKNESFGVKLGDLESIRERLSSVGSLIQEADEMPNDPNSVAALFIREAK